MATAFQPNAFQSSPLAFQIFVPNPTDMVGTEGHGASPGIQWVSMEDADRFRALVRKRDRLREDEWDERAEVRRLMDEVIAGPAPAPDRSASVPLVAPPQDGIDVTTWQLMLDELRAIQAEQADEDDIETILLHMATMH